MKSPEAFKKEEAEDPVGVAREILHTILDKEKQLTPEQQARLAEYDKAREHTARKARTEASGWFDPETAEQKAFSEWMQEIERRIDESERTSQMDDAKDYREHLARLKDVYRRRFEIN